MNANILTELDVVEDRIVARILAMQTSAGKNVAAFGDERAMKAMAKRFPFVGVVRSMMGDTWDPPETFATFRQSGTVNWEVFAFDRSMRGRRAARQARATGGGTYQLSGECVIVLQGFDPIEDRGGAVSLADQTRAFPPPSHPMWLVTRKLVEDDDGANYIEQLTFAHTAEI